MNIWNLLFSEFRIILAQRTFGKTKRILSFAQIFRIRKIIIIIFKYFMLFRKNTRVLK